MSMGLYNGKKAVVHLWGCHDQHTADGEVMLKRTATAYVVCSDRSQLKSRSLHKMKPPSFEHTFIEIVNTINVHRQT